MGLSGMGILLEACGSTQQVIKPLLENQTLRIAETAFINTNTLVIRHASLEYDILLVKHEATYVALQMRCTHNDVALQFSGKQLVCNAHGSEFNLEGKVTKEPALQNLRQYKTTVASPYILIHL
ncbi:MAG: hypothetical protein RIQ62_19 [Bacteroidota bacterium]